MTIRSAPLLAAALALLAAPAFAQGTGDAQLQPVDEPAQPAESPQQAEPAADAPDAPAEASAEAPAPALPPLAAPAAPAAASGAAPPTAARAIPLSPFTPDQRTGWLAQCRSAFLRAGATLGGGNGLPDSCETQLTAFERNYVPAADGQPPVIFVRVPVQRPAAAAAPDASVDADPDAEE